MRHRKRTAKLGRRADHRKAMLTNQVASLILEEQIRTTVPRAKETRRLTERLITLGKRGTLHHRRLAISRLHNKDAVRKLFNDLAPRFMEREGGYTRIIRLGTRDGDAADTCILQFVEAGAPSQSQVAPTPAETEAEDVVEETPAAAEEAVDEETEAERAEETADAEETDEEVKAEADEAEEAEEEGEKKD